MRFLWDTVNGGALAIQEEITRRSYNWRHRGGSKARELMKSPQMSTQGKRRKDVLFHKIQQWRRERDRVGSGNNRTAGEGQKIILGLKRDMNTFVG